MPQSNVFGIILGGNGTGEGNLDKLRNNEQTIAGYIKDRFRKSQLAKIGNKSSYFVKADSLNSEIPSNLYLLPGDIDLDICSKLVVYIGSSPVDGAWQESRYFLIEAFEITKSSDNCSKIFFIGCNPSFANYTELAIYNTKNHQ